ncbi:spermidine/putrescine ABC transporter permease PotC [Arcobacter aquimarinus]|uniref:Spermidine/putrescine transport system permease protein PotC n=1 Tax=Arcobacter aquimarinus TaxID=1315211 RepID=A0AAE7E0T9_9BACT|nr:spermidine/putrescine ABC transporter permease PotC [Arcobacter aquimarinus]MCB9096345.1 spermidine/putrescine ABC transporter permease PotC [Arcobacter sp.]QKE25207.1 iron(III)/spermidine/putrescine ABC transporter, permease protein [Arcobacter aquimarinus]RXI36345.1 spermidine/putrescine ABC transporter permease PotC [Arcobacter aquimarinus]
MRKLYASFIYILLYLPITVLIVYSFNNSKYSIEWKGFTTIWYENLISFDSLLEAAWHSVSVAFVSASIATVLGTLGALALFRYDFSGKKLMQSLVYVLIMSPEIVMGISFLMLFVFISLPLGFTTLLIAHVTFCLPFVIVTVMARLNGFDKNIIEAAKDLGASEFVTFINIILPNIIPAIVAGFLLSLTLSFDDVIISFFVTGPDYEILPLKIYSMVKLGVKPEINALCTIMFIFTLLMVLFTQFLIKEKK